MQPEFRIDVKQSYIHVTLSGILSSNTDRDFIDQVLSACVEHERYKILYDVRDLKGQFSTWDRFNIAVYFHKKKPTKPKDKKCASCSCWISTSYRSKPFWRNRCNKSGRPYKGHQ